MPNTLNLKFCLLNAENLFLLFDQPVPKNFEKLEENQWQKLSTSVYENKPLFKLQHLARTIKDINADIVMLCEVGGLESLKNFNTLFLNNEYSPILIEGNSDRNIDVGYLIRKNQSFYFDLLTHKNRDLNFLYPHEVASKNTNYPVKTVSHKLSRDCAELRLFTRELDKPFLIVLLTHLKSPLDPERIDPNGTERRTAELKTCLEIYAELKNQFPDCPILFAGDFNGQASSVKTDPEFLPLHQTTTLKDIFEIANVNSDNRYTFYQVRSGFRSDGRQIDYCFIDDKFKHLLNTNSVSVFEFRDEFGSPLRKPETLEQKMALPSDHYPIVFTLENVKF
jgi:endonuclease/exonuclease/phosphatase family metal-dependent hydrolase